MLPNILTAMEPRWQFSARDDSEWPQVLIEPTIDPATVLSDVGTVAGRSAPGYVRPGHDDGPGWAASFRSPMGLAAAADYQVFVADADNHAVRRIFGDGYVETIAGGDGHGFVDGRGAAARFFNPHGVAWRSSDGAVFVADTSNHAVRMISASQPGASGVVSTVWGAAGAGYATAEHRGNGTAALTNAPPSGLWNPQGVAIWRDGLLVADTDNHRILQLSPRSGGGWRLRAFAGTGNKGFEGATAFVASFRYPRSVAVCAGGAEVLVADSGNHAIRRVVAGPMTDSKGVEGLDWGEHAVVETLAGNGLPGIEDSRTRQEKPKASVLLTYQLAAQFALPYGVACAADGGALVSDTGNHRVRQVRTDGVTVTLAGTEDVGMLDGAGSLARFNEPRGLAQREDGSIWLAESGNHAVRRIFVFSEIQSSAAYRTAHAPPAVAAVLGIAVVVTVLRSRRQRVRTEGK